MTPLSTASSVSFTATTAPAGRISKVTLLSVSAATSAAKSLSIVTSSAEVGITDCTRIFTGLPAARAHSGRDRERRGGEGRAGELPSGLDHRDLLLVWAAVGYRGAGSCWARRGWRTAPRYFPTGWK